MSLCIFWRLNLDSCCHPKLEKQHSLWPTLHKRQFCAAKLGVYMRQKINFWCSAVHLQQNMMRLFLQRAPTAHVGGPAYVHTCLLSGSGGTAGVLALSLYTIFKPLCGSVLTHSRASETCCLCAIVMLHIVHLMNCVVRSLLHIKNTQVPAVSSAWLNLAVMIPLSRCYWVIEVSDRCIRINNDPDSWYFKLWISPHPNIRHQNRMLC